MRLHTYLLPLAPPADFFACDFLFGLPTHLKQLPEKTVANSSTAEAGLCVSIRWSITALSTDQTKGLTLTLWAVSQGH